MALTSSTRASESPPHPLEQLTVSESHIARDVVLRAHEKSVIDFRTIALEEPPKAQLQQFLEIENSGNLQSTTSRPARVARVAYDVIGQDKIPTYHASLVDVGKEIELAHEVIDNKHHVSLTLYDFIGFASIFLVKIAN